MDSVTEVLRRRVLHPLWAMREHPGLHTYLKEYERTQFWSPAQIRQLQWERLRKIVRFAYECCPYYTARFREAGFQPEDLREPHDLSKIPPPDER
jgi:phenylacetate-CoA ligase